MKKANSKRSRNKSLSVSTKTNGIVDILPPFDEERTLVVSELLTNLPNTARLIGLGNEVVVANGTTYSTDSRSIYIAKGYVLGGDMPSRTSLSREEKAEVARKLDGVMQTYYDDTLVSRKIDAQMLGMMLMCMCKHDTKQKALYVFKHKSEQHVLNAEYLYNALRFTGSSEILFHEGEPESPVMFTSDDKRCMAMVLPIRTEKVFSEEGIVYDNVSD